MTSLGSHLTRQYPPETWLSQMVTALMACRLIFNPTDPLTHILLHCKLWNLRSGRQDQQLLGNIESPWHHLSRGNCVLTERLRNKRSRNQLSRCPATQTHPSERTRWLTHQPLLKRFPLFLYFLLWQFYFKCVMSFYTCFTSIWCSRYVSFTQIEVTRWMLTYQRTQTNLGH